MSDKTLARRASIELFFKGVDISKNLADCLLSMTYTDNEEDETDDITISINDRDGTWINKWLHTEKPKVETVTKQAEIKVGNIVQFKGGPVYISSMAAEPTVNRGASKCKCTIANSNEHPYHLISQDGQRVYGWVNASDVEGETVTVTEETKAVEKKALKGTEIRAKIIQKNWNTNGKDKALDCGIFEIDNVSYSGMPRKLTIKATSIPYKAALRQTIRSEVYSNTTLQHIAEKIGKRSEMEVMYLSSYNPTFKRKEQSNLSDIVFLKKLCKDAGISLKVTANKIVLFDAEEYEKKEAIKKIKAGRENILSYSFDTKTADASYTSCHVKYIESKTKKTYEANYTYPNSNADGQTLEIDQRVTSNEEALELAKKKLREKNKDETTASFTLVGDLDLVAGVTVQVYGYGEFSGKYIIEKATHNITGGFKTSINLRSCLEGY